MSAFVVEDKTINQIVGFLYANRDFGYALEGLPNGEDPEKLAQAMLDLNVEAVNQRYRENSEPHKIQWHWERPNVYQALKSLRCWLYQCAEGSVPEHMLYVHMDQIAKEMSDYIINQLPEYRQAKWS